ncbi:MAG: aspartate/glutamate racemase family protein [Marmoricola sp.]
MKRIGLIGGMSWQSTAEYYRLINLGVQERLGGLHSADCVLRSVDFAAVEAMQVEGRWDDAAVLLAGAAADLESAGAELVLLCTNTMHKVAPQIEAALTVPFLHLADATAQAAVGSGLRRVGLLGTAFTMEQDFYRDRLVAHGLEVVVPDAADRELVHRVIYDELCLGIVSEESRTAYVDVIGRLVEQGCEGVVLGCTEIELLVGQDDSPVPLLATTSLHAAAAVELAVS